jgi:hypothetical protein
MIRVYTAQALAMASNVRNALEADGIPCVLRNEFLSAGRGELPPIECWPEVWVVNDVDAERARELMAEATESGEATGERWRCPSCAEEVDAVFAECWSCGAARRD